MAPRKTAAQKAAEVAGGVAAPEVQAAAPVEVPAGFDWAANKNKLTRAITWVKANQKGVVGKEYADAVRERYEALGGLVLGAQIATSGKRGGKTVNMAVNDEGEGGDE